MHNLKGKLLIPALGAEVVHGRSFRNFRNSFLQSPYQCRC